MRPPQFAGENLMEADLYGADLTSFNEAPAIRGGKPRTIGKYRFYLLASMRPPQFAGENGFKGSEFVKG